MLDNRCTGMYLLAAILVCGIPYVYPVTKGQRVRSSPDIPVTQFTCAGRPPGYYADLETGCQVYHMCTEGGSQFSYKCPNTTLFQQRMLICAHWYQVNCSRSEQHYGANLLIGQRNIPFVNDDPVLSKEKQVKTLHNPDTLQNLGQSSRDSSGRQAKSQSGNDNIQANRVFQNNLKRDGDSVTGFAGKPATFGTQSSGNNRRTSEDQSSLPGNYRRTSEDLSSLPLAGSVLPGGIKSFHYARAPEQRFSFKSQALQSTDSPHQSSTARVQYSNPPITTRQKVTPAVLFTSTTTTPKSISRVNIFSTTKSPVSFTSNNFHSDRFNKQSHPGTVFQDVTFMPEPSFEFLPPSDEKPSTDLTVASQENALSSRRSTTQPPFLEIGGSLTESDVEAEIELTKNGSFPDDKYNTFIKRFNPYEEEPLPTVTDKTEDSETEYHTFINRFVPDDSPSTPRNQLREQSEHVFVNRFVLTPEEQKREKDKQEVNKLHDLLPPVDDQLTVNFPNFDLMPPLDDSDDSESNKIELHLQDPRRAFFIPNEDENEFSKADAAPIVVTIPLRSHQKSPPMWFRTNDSDDPCARCHPSFIVNKDNCMPCVIIR